MLLIAIDIEMLRVSCSQICNRLTGQVHFHLSLQIILNTLKQFCEECLAHLYRKNEVIQFVVLVDIRKERTNHNPEAIARNSPCSMLTTGARTEVLARYEDAALVFRIIQDEILNQATVGTIAPVTKKVIAKTLLIRCLEETGRDNLVGIYIL